FSRSVAVVRQRTQTSEYTQYVTSVRLLDQVAPECFENKIDFLFKRLRLKTMTVERCIGRSDKEVIMPRHSEQDATVVRCRNHQSRFTVVKLPAQYYVNALTGSDHGTSVRLVHPQNLVNKDTGSVYYAGRLNVKWLACFQILRFNSYHFSVDRLRQAGDTHIVHKHAACLCAGLG